MKDEKKNCVRTQKKWQKNGWTPLCSAQHKMLLVDRKHFIRVIIVFPVPVRLLLRQNCCKRLLLVKVAHNQFLVRDKVFHKL